MGRREELKFLNIEDGHIKKYELQHVEVTLENDSHEISSLIFTEKKKN